MPVDDPNRPVDFTYGRQVTLSGDGATYDVGLGDTSIIVVGAGSTINLPPIASVPDGAAVWILNSGPHSGNTTVGAQDFSDFVAGGFGYTIANPEDATVFMATRDGVEGPDWVPFNMFGSLALGAQAAHRVYAGPVAGTAPATFRLLSLSDLPSLVVTVGGAELFIPTVGFTGPTLTNVNAAITASAYQAGSAQWAGRLQFTTNAGIAANARLFTLGTYVHTPLVALLGSYTDATATGILLRTRPAGLGAGTSFDVLLTDAIAAAGVYGLQYWVQTV